MIKKILGIAAVGSITTVVLKEGYNYIQILKENKQSVDQIGRLLDPFVIAYKDSTHDFESFSRIIKEKLPQEDVKVLRNILKHRCKQLSFLDGSYAYSCLVDAIDDLLPVEGSITDIRNKHCFSSTTEQS